jgi:hypothetical protein
MTGNRFSYIVMPMRCQMLIASAPKEGKLFGEKSPRIFTWG